MEPLKITFWDFDLGSRDDLLGHVDVDLGNHAYCNEIRRDCVVDLDTTGSAALQVWWEPEGGGAEKRARRVSSVLTGAPTRRSWMAAFRRVVCLLVPRRLRTLRGCCAACCIKVLHPECKSRNIWNVCLAFFILWCGISVPLEIAFEADMVRSLCVDPADPFGPPLLRGDCGPYLQWFWLNFVVDVWFMCDIALNFRTGYVSEGHFVSDDWLVAKDYLKGSFVMDVLGTFPLNIVTMILDPANPYGDPQLAALQAQQAAAGGGVDPGRANRLLRLMRMAKLAKLARMRKLAKYAAAFEEYLNPGVVAVIKLVFIALFCCHLFGCLWWMVSDLEISEEESGSISFEWYAGENNWHPPHWLRNEPSLMLKYMHAFFWGAGMVTSLVPRDIEPLTVLECIITNATMFFGLLLNAFVISSLTQALAHMNSKKELTGKQLETIRTALIVKGVPSELRGRVMEYYEYLLGSSAALEDRSLFDSLPPALSAQLNLSTNRKLAARCAFFKGVSNASLLALISELKALVFVPDQLIVKQGLLLADVYFINRGLVRTATHDGASTTLTNADNVRAWSTSPARPTDRGGRASSATLRRAAPPRSNLRAPRTRRPHAHKHPP